MKYPKLSDASSARGASMGRPNVVLEPESEIRFRLYRMPMVDYDYDTGGAYWGGSSTHGVMYHAYGDGPKYKNECFIRAKDRKAAKEAVRKLFPKATFYR